MLEGESDEEMREMLKEELSSRRSSRVEELRERTEDPASSERSER